MSSARFPFSRFYLKPCPNKLYKYIAKCVGGMLMVLLSYVLLGLSLSAPIGPINAAQLDKGIRGGFMPAWLVGLGAVMGDIIYMILVYLGVVHFLDTPFMKSFLWSFGFFILIYIGVESLWSARKITLKETRSSEPLSKSLLRRPVYVPVQSHVHFILAGYLRLRTRPDGDDPRYSRAHSLQLCYYFRRHSLGCNHGNLRQRLPPLPDRKSSKDHFSRFRPLADRLWPLLRISSRSPALLVGRALIGSDRYPPLRYGLVRLLLLPNCKLKQNSNPAD